MNKQQLFHSKMSRLYRKAYKILTDIEISHLIGTAHQIAVNRTMARLLQKQHSENRNKPKSGDIVDAALDICFTDSIKVLDNYEDGSKLYECHGCCNKFRPELKEHQDYLAKVKVMLGIT